MMDLFKTTLQSTGAALTMSDMNSTLKSLTKYAWLTAGALFACYLYFVGAITFSVIAQEGLAQEIRATVSQTSKEELKYLTVQRRLTEEYAKEQGFVSPQTISYTAPASSFAWNMHARQ